MNAPVPALTVARIPRHAARTLVGKCALDDGRRQLTYAELEAEVQRLAAGMRASGVGRGDVVSAYLPNCIEYVVVVLAVARAGAVFSPINPRFKAYEIAALLGQAQPRCLFVTRDRADVALDAAGRARLGDVRVVCVDAEASPAPGLHGYREWPRGEDSLPEVEESDFFSLMFTSGTTGTPKGALATHRARMVWVLNAAIHYGLSQDDRYLGMMPQVHSAGLTFALMHLYVGATVRILEHFDPLAFLEIVERERITSTLTVPTMLTMILEAQEKGGRPFDLKSLKRVVTCGSPLPLMTKQRVIERISPQLYDYYGSTESNSMSVLNPPDQLRKPASVGRPFINVEFRIASPEGGALPASEVGEIWCANPSVMTRYLGMPEETEAAFSDGWYRTGDLGYLDEEGFLFIVGRSKDMVVSGGVNIYPAEIEQVMMLHPAVLDCAVLGVPDAVWGEAVKAYVVLRERGSMTLAEAQAHCLQYLADYKKPRFLEVVREIPKNAGGKTMKSVLAGDQRASA
jgi:acyl-CoA synthetase (AMP-forming)/AMP-acid ligase II